MLETNRVVFCGKETPVRNPRVKIKHEGTQMNFCGWRRISANGFCTGLVRTL